MKPSPNPLILSASRASWAVSANHGTELDRTEKMVALRPKILRRDDHTCQGCGLRSERWQEIHHRNDDHRDFREKNLETLCPFCHQVFHLPLAASTCGGTLIWLPEMSQSDLNRLCGPLFVAVKTQKSRWSGQARQLIGYLEARGPLMESSLGSSDPGLLAQVLLNLGADQYAKREKMLAGIRLLPLPARFQNAIDYWEAALYNDPDRWQEVLPDSVNLSALVGAQGT